MCSHRAEQNILEAIANGASVSVGLVGNIAANLIAFLAVLEFINGTLAWLGNLVNIAGLSFQVLPKRPPSRLRGDQGDRRVGRGNSLH